MLQIQLIRKFRLTLWRCVQIWIPPQRFLPANITIFDPLSRSILCRRKRCHNLRLSSARSLLFSCFPLQVTNLRRLGWISSWSWYIVQSEVRKPPYPTIWLADPIEYGDEPGHTDRPALPCESNCSLPQTAGFREDVIRVDVFFQGWG